MDNQNLSLNDCNLLLESLEFSRYKFETYPDYPSPQFRRNRINEVIGLIDKIRRIRAYIHIDNIDQLGEKIADNLKGK